MKVKIVKEVKRSDSLWRFACGDVLDFMYSAFTLIQAKTVQHCFWFLLECLGFLTDLFWISSDVWFRDSASALTLIQASTVQHSFWFLTDFFWDFMYSDSETWHLPYPWFRHQQCSAASASLLTFSPNSVLVRQLANLVSGPDFCLLKFLVARQILRTASVKWMCMNKTNDQPAWATYQIVSVHVNIRASYVMVSSRWASFDNSKKAKEK